MKRGLLNHFSRATLLVLLFGLTALWSGCGNPTADQTAQAFFEALRTGRYDEAWAKTAFAFQAQCNEKIFQQASRDLGITGANAIQIDPADIQGDEAKFNGHIQTAGGLKINFTVVLLKEKERWNIFEIRNETGVPEVPIENRFTTVGRATELIDPSKNLPPTPAQAAALTKKTILAFNHSVQDQDFTTFYDGASNIWKNQTSPKRLLAAFEPFIANGVNLAGIEGVEPVFDMPLDVDVGGILMIQGHFETTPLMVFFTLRFYYEMPRWRVFGLEIQLRNVEATPANAEATPTEALPSPAEASPSP